MSAMEAERRPATPEEIWEILRQVAMRQKKADEIRDEARDEARREMRELRDQMQETDRRLRRAEGLFTSQWGRLMESLVEGDLVKLLKERNVEVETVAYLKAHEGTTRYAMRKGLFVIRATGSSAGIVNEPDFEPCLFGSPAAS